MKKGWIIILLAAAVGVIAYQFHSINSLKQELRQNAANPTVATEVVEVQNVSANRPAPTLQDLPRRVHDLEQAVAQLARAAEHLMDRGMVPPNAQKLQQLQNAFNDPNATFQQRIQAFRLLRRNGAVTDEIASQAVNWLQSMTNANARRDLLGNLDGLTNETLKQPLFALLSTEADGNTREELVDVLADFARSDSAIEQKLWELAANDPDSDVREEAQDALIDGDKTPQQLASLMAKARDTSQPIEARLLALRGLRENDSQVTDVVADIAALAQNSQDPDLRRKIFGAFDGMSDPHMMVPLVYGLQDQDASVRARAADALSSFSAEPQVQQWLTHIAQNDGDPRVRREAQQALEEAQRRARRGRNND